MFRSAAAALLAGVVTLSVTAEDGPRSPLHRLKHRNAQDRWQQAREQWMVPRTNETGKGTPPTAEHLPAGSPATPSPAAEAPVATSPAPQDAAKGVPDQAIPLTDLWKTLPPTTGTTRVAESAPIGPSNAPTPDTATPADGTQWRSVEKTAGVESPVASEAPVPGFLPPVLGEDTPLPAAPSVELEPIGVPIAETPVPESTPAASEFRSPEIVKQVPPPYVDDAASVEERSPAVDVRQPAPFPAVDLQYPAPPFAVTPEMLPGRIRSAANEPGFSVIPRSPSPAAQLPVIIPAPNTVPAPEVAQAPVVVPAPTPPVVLLETVPPAPIPEAAGTFRPNMESKTPGRFRRISEIQPYYDYTPGGGDPGKYLCPVPPGTEADPLNACPPMAILPQEGSIERYFAHVDYCWEPSNLFHNPLYFEDVALERYGHTYCDLVQPFVSLGKFGVQVVGLPYTMVLNRPLACEYPLGYYRPGDCAPYLTYQVPLNLKAAAAAGGIYTGLFILFP